MISKLAVRLRVEGQGSDKYKYDWYSGPRRIIAVNPEWAGFHSVSANVYLFREAFCMDDAMCDSQVT